MEQNQLGRALLRHRNSAGTRNFRDAGVTVILIGTRNFSEFEIPEFQGAVTCVTANQVYGRYQHLNDTGLDDDRRVYWAWVYFLSPADTK